MPSLWLSKWPYAYAGIPSPGIKKLVTLKGIHHYGIYREKRLEAQKLALDWYNLHLKTAK